MPISREEFDKLAARVDRIERTQGALVEMMSAEIVGLRTHIDERFDGVDGRLDGINGRLDEHGRKLDEHGRVLEEHGRKLDEQGRKLDSYTEQVQVAIRQGSEAAARNERFARAIADHFGIELGES